MTIPVPEMPVFARALRSRNYRLYFLGQLVSLAGTWMQQIAMIWLAYRLSGSAFVLGTIGFASQIPILIFASIGGVWTDRLDRRRLLLWTQALSMLQALALAALAWQERVSPGLLLVLAFFLGCINALDVPARQAIAVQLLDDPDDLPNAIALNSLVMNSARFVGPALAGFVVAAVGEAMCFLLNALSYLAVLVALRAIRIAAVPGQPTPTWTALRQGYRYVLRHRQIRRSLLLVAGVSFLATPYAVLMPIFARQVFAGDALTYGLLIGSAGAGSLLAALFLAARADTRDLHRSICRAAPAVGLCLLVFSLTSQRWLAFPVLAGLGFSVILTVAGSNTLIQTAVDDEFRGRIMALFSMAFLGVAPLGSLALGTLAHACGIRRTLAACGALVLVAGVVYGQVTQRSGREA